MPNLRQWFYDGMYRFFRPRWDTGITPPEVVSLLESGRVQGSALDLGCGTGTNSIYLARHGFSVTGVDFSPKAIELGRQKARQAGVTIDFHRGDVTRLDFLREPFELVLDIGCFHSLNQAGRDRYTANLVRLTHPGSIFMLYAFEPDGLFGNLGVTSAQAQQQFAPHFVVDRVEHGGFRKRGSNWYWFNRSSA